MAGRLKLEYFATGFWLGSCQVALTFHLLYSQGASVVYYFALISLWLAGSVLALLTISKSAHGLVLKWIGLFAFVLAGYLSRAYPFLSISLVAVLAAVIVLGMYAGWFLKSCVDRDGDIRAVMLYENNGFILGYAIAGGLLFFSISSMDLIATLAGAILVFPDILGLFKYFKKVETKS